jgi:hypothetical protein
MLLVALTGGAGFLASYSLLQAGVDELAWRYGLALAIAYVFFLMLLWLWLRTSSDDYDGLDEVIVEVVDAIPDGAGRVATRMQGHGGEFGGGGARSNWTHESTSEPLVELPDLPDMPDISGVADADEVAIPLAVVLFVGAVVLTVLAASFSIIWSAPILFAEVLVDGVLAATLYRRLRRLDSRHWLQSAVRRTIAPFAVTAVLVMIAGWGFQVYAPEARTIGEVFARP